MWIRVVIVIDIGRHITWIDLQIRDGLAFGYGSMGREVVLVETLLGYACVS